jgi:flagellar basal body rod protein FlgG
MFLSSSLNAALDRIAERAADVRRAYTPGAVPQHDDVARPTTLSDFTLDPLAVTAPDGVYFITSDDQGRTAYTRDGAFQLRGGKLADADGQFILGERTQAGALGELAVDPVDEALGRIQEPGIERDGSFVYRRDTVDPRSGSRESQRVVVGRIALARFPAGTRLETTDGTHCIAPGGVIAQRGFAAERGFAPLTPMHRERSRIDIDESLVRLKDAYLAFDALQAAEAARAHLGKTAMDLLK